MKRKVILITLLTILSASSVIAQQPVPPLSLERVMEIYLQNNLDLQAARSSIERTKADQIAARLRPNPGITITAENLKVSGPTPFSRLYELGATYSETIELGGKRTLRQKAADATISAAEAQFEDTMRVGIAEVKRLYFEALLARHNLDITMENRETFDQLVQFNLTRFQEGAIPELDLIKVRLERVKYESTVKQAEVSLRQAGIRLLNRLGTTDFSTPQITGELSFRALNVDLNLLRQIALKERSDIRAAVAEVNAANERLALERGRSTPDINPFAGFKRVGQDDTLLFGVNIPLKLRDHNQADIARAEANIRTAEVRLQMARNRAAAEVEAAYAALVAAQELVTTFQNEILRQADESRSITLAAYEEGGTELLPVLDAQRTRSEVRLQYFKTLFDYQASIVALELAAGREIQP